MLAYSDVFLYCAVGAFCIVPLTFLFGNYRPQAGAEGACRALEKKQGGSEPFPPDPPSFNRTRLHIDGVGGTGSVPPNLVLELPRRTFSIIADAAPRPRSPARHRRLRPGAARRTNPRRDSALLPAVPTHEQILHLAGDPDRPADLVTTLYLPQGNGPFPLAVDQSRRQWHRGKAGRDETLPLHLSGVLLSSRAAMPWPCR